MNPIAVGEPAIVRSPFPHFIADGFFTGEFHDRLCAYGREKLTAGEFRPFSAEYDASWYTPEPTLDPANPISFFFSRELQSYMARAFDRPLNDDVYVGLHHHAPGGADGFVHADFNLVSMINPLPLDNG